MEFAHGRIRDRFYIISTDREEEEQVDKVSRHPPLINLSSSSSPAAAAAENSAVVVEKEHMFDKVVTPSDVGKLNRLVIPKQHAEKYFPLDTAANEKGLLLSFEDRTGKPWRFRYSYWNSSQSYVMTKGWSRFVKEKGLDAGDTVSFGRGVGEAARHRLFIDWKRQPQRRVVVPPRIPLPGFSFARFAGPWSGRLFVPPAATAAACGNNWQSSVAGGGQRLYFTLPTTPRPPQREVQQVLDSVPPLGRHDEAAAGKRVRLFGVNLDCPESDCDTNHQNKSLRTALETPVSSSSMSKKQRSPLDLYL